MATRRLNPGTWRKEKQNNDAIKRRRWDLGAWINNENNLEIYRGPDSEEHRGRTHRRLRASENKNLVLRQEDTETNPEVLEIINLGSNNAITVRKAVGGAVTGGIDTDGNAFASSSEELKSNIRNMSDSVAEKHIDGLTPKSFTFNPTGKKSFGLIAENFQEITGYGDGKTITPAIAVGLAIRYVQFLWKRTKSLEAKVAALERSTTTDGSGE